MIAEEFVDYYELLQLSSNADTDTVERVFRHQAKKFHPDTSEVSDNDRFYQLVEAHRVLVDPVSRVAYDARYQKYWDRKWKVASEASDRSAFGDDQLVRERLLSLLYVQRRRNVGSPGMGELEIARLLSTPPELVEFHLWYLKNKGWVERLDTGYLAITAIGVDQVEQGQLRIRPDHLIEAPGPACEGAGVGENGKGDRNLLASDAWSNAPE